MINTPPTRAAVPLRAYPCNLRKTPANLSNQKITLSIAAHSQKTNLKEPMNRLAQPRINLASVSDEGTERFPDVVPDHEIGDVVLFGRLVVDNDQTRTRVFRHQGESGRRPHHQ